MWSAIAGAAGAIGSALLGAHSAKASADRANKITMDLAKNGIQYRVQDLRKAGLNPILAVTGSGGLGSVSSSGIQAAQPADFSGAVSSAVAAFDALTKRQQQQVAKEGIESQIALQRNQIANSAADVRLKDAQAAAALQNVENMKTQSNLTNQQILTEASRRANIEAQTGLSSAQRIRTQYQTVQDKVLADYLNTPVGAESARVNMDASSGGLIGGLNTWLSSYKRDHEANSAKKVNKGGRFPPSQFQQQLINNYRR
ncbi:hypothetical protein BvCmsF30A_01613 [Escherichia coli]|uniref:hypothetical protein n=3 Tax=Escherichia coli TaxID=562 RepID=UPI000707B187|nr:hypothetical protein [Escherichia coli]APJ77461.1 hypothetical protein RG28_14720 [Escherichia coli]EEW8805978.1 hypothetical protein [Escherichia coli]EEY4099050.1 hypothetical protein [Escherichia coli]EFA4746196.1 hypothetical protein [Escherichia coli]EFD0579729.1 hypothetical protein [Escherichia coli]